MTIMCSLAQSLEQERTSLHNDLASVTFLRPTPGNSLTPGEPCKRLKSGSNSKKHSPVISKPSVLVMRHTPQRLLNCARNSRPRTSKPYENYQIDALPNWADPRRRRPSQTWMHFESRSSPKWRRVYGTNIQPNCRRRLPISRRKRRRTARPWKMNSSNVRSNKNKT